MGRTEPVAQPATNTHWWPVLVLGKDEAARGSGKGKGKWQPKAHMEK